MEIDLILLAAPDGYARDVGRGWENMGSGVGIFFCFAFVGGAVWLVYIIGKEVWMDRHSAPPNFTCYKCGHQHENFPMPQHFEMCSESPKCYKYICSGCGGQLEGFGYDKRRPSVDPRWPGEEERYCPKCNWWMPSNWVANKSVDWENKGWDGRR